ncbi:hypothetical protein TeGR_g971, partial [Tetraparma gracilis]
RALTRELDALKSAMEEMSKAEASAAAGSSAQKAGGGALTVMLKAQIGTLKTENAILSKAKDDSDVLRLEREEMSIEVQRLKMELINMQQQIDDLETEAVQKNAASALPDMMKQVKLRKEREEAAKHDAEQIRFLQVKHDNVRQQLLELTSNVCDVIVGFEENLSRDGADVGVVEVEEGDEMMEKVKV